MGREVKANVGVGVTGRLGMAVGACVEVGWSIAALTGVSVARTVIFLWAMACNPFFSESVRIQTGHQVAHRGPYRMIRHPGYAGACLQFIATPLILGSRWALIPAALAIVGYIIRTALEDRTLREELAGYQEYQERVRFRLFPGLW